MLLDKQFTYFEIANHLVELIHSPDVDLALTLPSFTSFAAAKNGRDHILSVTLTTEPAPDQGPVLKLLSDISIVWEERFLFEETANGYLTTIEAEQGEGAWKMVSSKDFAQCIIYAQPEELYTTLKSAWLILMAFGQAALLHNTVLLHASVIERNGIGYAFLGKSGTGKSTHSSLWLKYIEGTQLMNDDNPAVRVYENGDVYIYGSPWSGKTPCYKQLEAKLGSIVRLEQAPVNDMEWKKGKDALITLLPSCSAIRWNQTLFDNMLQTVGTIIKTVPVGKLRCLPDRDAALLCEETIRMRQFL